MINQQLKESAIFTTQELALAAALVAWGFLLDSVERLPSDKKSKFIFLRSPELDNAVQAFWDGSGKTTPKIYFNALREVKSRLYSAE